MIVLKFNKCLIYIAAVIILAGITKAQENNDKSSCIKCHTEVGMMPDTLHFMDIHFSNGISCHNCHGGNPEDEEQESSMSPKHSFVGVPEADEIPKFCGKCHSNIEYMRKFRPQIATDQETQFYTSIHGKKLLLGDKNVAVCTSCHTAHKIFPSSDPRSTVYAINLPMTCQQCHSSKEKMAEYKIPTDQYAKYKASVHGVALLENFDTGAPACNDCHGNHGAVPPGVESISYVCGNCHKNNMDYFAKSKMNKAFDDQSLHACEVCHGYHDIKRTSVEMLGDKEESLCKNCHVKGDVGYTIGMELSGKLELISREYEKASKNLKEVKIKGMNDVDMGYLLQDAKQKLILSKTAVHSFDTSVVNKIVNEGLELIKKSDRLGIEEIEEYNYRRTGFIYISIVFFVFLIAFAYKIKFMKTGQTDE